MFSSSGRNTIYFYERNNSSALWKHSTLTSIYEVTLSENGSYLAASEGGMGTKLYYITPFTSLPDPYSLNASYAKVGKTFVYEVIEWNETLAGSLGIALSDIDPSAGVGLRRCYEITQITKMTDYWIINYKAWNWGMDFYGYTPYSDSIDIYVYPAGEGMDVDYIHSDLMSIIPTPVAAYLDGIDWSSDSSSSGLSYSYEQYLSPHYFDLFIEYCAEGFLKSLVWTYNENVLLNISYIGERAPGGPISIPFGEFYVGITLSTMVILIIFVNKKKK